MFAKLTFRDSRLKYIAFVYESLGLILDTPILNILKIHSLFIQSPKNAFKENLEIFIHFQQGSNNNLNIFNNGNHVQMLI